MRTSRTELTAVDVLRRDWRRWTAIVELFARRRAGRRRVNRREYAALHRELLATCQTLARASEEGKQVCYTHLESLVQPWLTPRMLAQTDRDILFDLLLRCEQVEQELGGRVWHVNPPRWLLPASLIAGAGAVVLFLLVLVAGSWSSVSDVVRDVTDTLWFAFRHASDLQKLLVAALLVVFVSIFTVSRTARS